MSSYCEYINCNCKYCEEGHCDFPIQGSGYPYDAPCFRYEEEDDECEWIPVRINKQMLKCSNCGFMVNKELIYDYTDPHPLVFKYCPNCGKKMNKDVTECQITKNEESYISSGTLEALKTQCAVPTLKM